jgi:hypothetical protein
LYAMTHGITVNSAPKIPSIVPIRKTLDQWSSSQTNTKLQSKRQSSP